ncbi:hypothetical protein BDFB_000734 [Asbolus verrucosus]|uniref:Uncharacterized protein n=1 Tax=Asbolus verrucosus TaxID=1661398 RepID=A0A482VDY9_ASBVE|nr:hypothetical protein BDFB_000734 [Asbolus verrucosus]
MGDTDQKTENLIEPPANTDCDVSKPSIDILKEVKPSENISIDQTNTSLMNLETTFEPLEPTVTTTETEKAAEETPQAVDETKDAKEEQKEKARNRSDIFSLNENKNLPSTIFSVGGAPSKTIHKTISAGSNKTSSSIDTIVTQTSNMSKQSQYRNPLTGIGVSSNDEFKNKPSKRRGRYRFNFKYFT